MIRFLLAMIGFVSLIFPALAADDPPFRLYERLKEITIKDQLLGDSEEDVQKFVARSVKDEKINKEVQPEDVKLALEKRPWEFCLAVEGRYGSCPDLYGKMKDTADRVSRSRVLGRDLLLIAQGYEMGIDGFMGEPLGILTKFPAILHIWQSGADHLFSPVKEMPMRAAPLPEEVNFSDLESQLNNLKADTPAAIWRYRYGLKAVKEQKEEGKEEECDGKKGSGELFKVHTQRWCEVESALKSIADALPKDLKKYDPPLEPDQVVIFPTKRLEGVPNATVWMTSKLVDGEIKSDAGLGWDLSLEPVLPGILPDDGAGNCMEEVKSKAYCDTVENKKILPGGLYPDPPPEPKTWQGVCALPLAKSGFLCRPLASPGCNEEIDRGSSGTNARAIILTRCLPENFKGPTGLTTTGPDLCKLGPWRSPTSSSESSVKDTSGEDADLKPDDCSGCVVDLYCGTCENDLSGTTKIKDDKGVIKICISSSIPRSVLPGTILHELVHAQQFCPLALGEKILDTNVTDCCAYEREGGMVECNALAEQGILERIGATVDECATASANISCQRFGSNANDEVCSPPPVAPGASSGQESKTEKFRKDLKKALEKEDERHPNSPSCQKLIDDLAKLEPRAAAMKEGLKFSCKPGCQTKYENTIGNNLCYLDQCTEESVEGSRLTPGRLPLTTGDQTFPWEACEAPDPKNGSALGIPAETATPLPSYGPRFLVQSLDSALCQISGMPPKSPPVLCSFLTSRSIDIPLKSYLDTAMGLQSQPKENTEYATGLQKMMQGVGTRIGTSILSDYLKRSLQSLTSLLQAVNTLTTQMEKIKFPLTACPRNAAQGNICSQLSQ